MQTNLPNPSWQFRDAAIMAFGVCGRAALMCRVGVGGTQRGVSHAACAVGNIMQCGPYDVQAAGHIIGMMKDPSAVVKDSVSWLLSRIIDMFPDVGLSDAVFVPLVQALLAGLDMEPRVAANCCWVCAGRGV